MIDNNKLYPIFDDIVLTTGELKGYYLAIRRSAEAVCELCKKHEEHGFSTADFMGYLKCGCYMDRTRSTHNAVDQFGNKYTTPCKAANIWKLVDRD